MKHHKIIKSPLKNTELDKYCELNEFIRSCTDMAHFNAIREGFEFVLIDGLFCFHPAMCKNILYSEIIKYGIEPEHYNLTNIHKEARISFSQGGYVKSLSRRVRLYSGIRRTLVIDLSQAGKFLKIRAVPGPPRYACNQKINLEEGAI